MNKEEKKAIELLENIRNNTWTTKYIMSSDSKNAEVLINLIEKLQDDNIKLIKNLEFYNMQGSNTKLEIYIKDNFISKKKIKNKIEEVKEFSENAISSVGHQLTIEILQELLEGDN